MCGYCDFYRTTSVALLPEFLNAVKKEIDQRCLYLEGEKVETIYFGGGTPSFLSPAEAELLLADIAGTFSLGNGEVEITLEANPDDLEENNLRLLREAGFNRISIGIQSFNDRLLTMMNRRHTADQAVRSVENACKAGFQNITIDLIYGLPGLSAARWEQTLLRAVALPVKHISAYHLTFHEDTPFYRKLGSGALTGISEAESLKQFDILLDVTSNAGFEQYEISNFAREQAYSRHNCGYWLGAPYLGLGPSAHSYNKVSRQWNCADLPRYVDAMEKGTTCFDMELLTGKDKLNEYLITRIRTKWGISRDDIEFLSGGKAWNQICKASQTYLESGHLLMKEGTLFLTKRGIMISDQIMLALIV